MRRHGSLLLAVALHAGLIAAALYGLQSTFQQEAPREVVISLLSMSSTSTPAYLPKSAPAPATPPQTVAQPERPPMPTPLPAVQPIQPAAVQPAAQAVPVAHDTHVPVAPVQAAPTAISSVPSTPPQEVRNAPIAVAPAPAPVAAPAAPASAARGPVTVSGVEYLSPPKVDYPISARRAGLEGKVLLRLLIDEKGLPQRADVQQSSGHVRLDEAARAAAMRALFKPHVEDGQPMPVYALVPISFSLK